MSRNLWAAAVVFLAICSSVFCRRRFEFCTGSALTRGAEAALLSTGNWYVTSSRTERVNTCVLACILSERCARWPVKVPHGATANMGKKKGNTMRRCYFVGDGHVCSYSKRKLLAGVFLTHHSLCLQRRKSLLRRS